ncbi:uncharacterized protein LOC126670252 [Mercurialis annua]|uniref:uncharacterized protein LOC126670252 n=1 Tax=Mercurialis annua TaxID=3986 RepID=UPI00215E9FAD|nr:uncharacterized protein LOC126670252 [Mercurialis annua]
MKQVKTPLETPSLSEDPLSKASHVKGSQENGIKVSPNGKEVDSNVNDLAGKKNGTVHLDDRGEEMSLEDFEVNNGASSLLEMHGSKGSHGLDSILDVIQLDQNLGVELYSRDVSEMYPRCM